MRFGEGLGRGRTAAGQLGAAAQRANRRDFAGHLATSLLNLTSFPASRIGLRIRTNREARH